MVESLVQEHGITFAEVLLLEYTLFYDCHSRKNLVLYQAVSPVTKVKYYVQFVLEHP